MCGAYSGAPAARQAPRNAAWSFIPDVEDSAFRARQPAEHYVDFIEMNPA
jgi:hypothetical protein